MGRGWSRKSRADGTLGRVLVSGAVAAVLIAVMDTKVDTKGDTHNDNGRDGCNQDLVLGLHGFLFNIFNGHGGNVVKNRQTEKN